MSTTGAEAPVPQEPEDPARRKFLLAATGLLGACAGAAALAPALAAVFSPLAGGIVTFGAGLVDLGPLEAFEAGVPRKVVVHAARTDAFVKEGERALGSVLVVRAGNEVIALSSTCPHAGCDVAASSDGKLACPCHESRFALDGQRLTGPSPRALDRLATEVKDGHVFVRFERFQVGIEEKRAV
jgi:cytochrome b6-f complex iron-sulfur subunit/menaquinol-cytochrome c reductase iron-sulfur subunit